MQIFVAIYGKAVSLWQVVTSVNDRARLLSDFILLIKGAALFFYMKDVLAHTLSEGLIQ